MAKNNREMHTPAKWGNRVSSLTTREPVMVTLPTNSPSESEN